MGPSPFGDWEFGLLRVYISKGAEVIVALVKQKGFPGGPLWVPVPYPVNDCPFAYLVSSRENTASLDVSDLHDILVLGEDIAELLAGRAVAHRGVDMLKDFGRVSRSFGKERLDLLSDSYCFHSYSPHLHRHFFGTTAGCHYRLT